MMECFECKNYICIFCAEEIGQRSSVRCPFCSKEPFKVVDVVDNKPVKLYTDTPYGSMSSNFEAKSKLALKSKNLKGKENQFKSKIIKVRNMQINDFKPKSRFADRNQLEDVIEPINNEIKKISNSVSDLKQREVIKENIQARMFHTENNECIEQCFELDDNKPIEYAVESPMKSNSSFKSIGSII